MFTDLTTELMNEGFLGDLLSQMEEVPEETKKAPKVPRGHKKPQK